MPTATSVSRLSWLQDQVRDWQRTGLVDERQAERILAGYTPRTRWSLARLLLAVGACFVGVGALWLVVANLEALSLAARLALATAVWLAALAGGEVLARRRAPASVVGTVRLLAALLAGPVVYQAAQNLDVALREPLLTGCWAAVALAHAYAARAVLPLLVGVATATTFVVRATLEASPGAPTAVLALTGAGVAAVALAALHDDRLPVFADAWRLSGAGLLLATLVGAAVPGVDVGDDTLPLRLVAGLVAVGLLAGAGLVAGSPLGRLEIVAAIAVLGAAAALVWWQVTADAATDPTPLDLTRALVGLLLCVAAALAVAVDGTVRDERLLVALGTTALVVATTLQAFTVFAPVLEGAWLFLALGAVLLAIGLLFDRTRRRVAAAL